MRRVLLALAMLLCASVAHAQSTQGGYNVPTDVPLYVAQPVAYAAGVTANVLGDGSNPRGGTMAVIASQLADIPATASGWIITAGTYQTIPPGTQPKFRSVGNLSHIAFDDPIRNFAKPGTSHLHCFFGNTGTNAYSTYASLRTYANAQAAANKPASTVPGGPYNGTAYWYPCPIKTVSSVQYVVKPYQLIFYYVRNDTGPYLQRMPRGTRYVGGFNMTDPDDTGQAAEIATANAQTGTAGRYASEGHGIGWHCFDSTGNTEVGTGASWLKNADGSDPWAGACVDGDQMVAYADAPACYDGHNLWSPGGYAHFRYYLRDNTVSGEVCPQGWYRVPQFTLHVFFHHHGFSDYGNWRLSSDDMAAATAGHAIQNGQSFHFDWLGAWDDTTFITWQQNCVGTDGVTVHECDTSLFDPSTGHGLTGGQGENAPDNSRRPQFNNNVPSDTNVLSQMLRVPGNAPYTLHPMKGM